jgi:hypothetical protein
LVSTSTGSHAHVTSPPMWTAADGSSRPLSLSFTLSLNLSLSFSFSF